MRHKPITRDAFWVVKHRYAMRLAHKPCLGVYSKLVSTWRETWSLSRFGAPEKLRPTSVVNEDESVAGLDVVVVEALDFKIVDGGGGAGRLHRGH